MTIQNDPLPPKDGDPRAFPMKPEAVYRLLTPVNLRVPGQGS